MCVHYSYWEDEIVQACTIGCNEPLNMNTDTDILKPNLYSYVFICTVQKTDRFLRMINSYSASHDN